MASDLDTAPRLLLVGAGGPLPRQAELAGWQVQQVEDPFAALDRLAGDLQLEAVLVRYDAFQPRGDELIRALRQTRPSLPVYLLCPAWLEPEARRLVESAGGIDYLVEPVWPADWQSLARQVRPAEPTAVPAEQACCTDRLEDLDHLIENIGGLLEPLLSSAAAWASSALGDRTVRIRWASESAKHPAGQPDPHPSRSFALADAAGRPRGEFVVQVPSAGPRGSASLAGPVEQSARRVAATISRLLALRERLTAFRQMAFTDPLSGAHNRRYLMLFLDRLIARARRENFRVTLLMFDIDDFKQYNDRYGHHVGDEIITDIARLMRQTSRPHDVVARIGGDEFAVLFWDQGPPRQPGSHHPREAAAVAERFRRALASHQFRSLGPQAAGTLTISGGLASYPTSASDAVGLLTVAGEGLKAAKRSGKNRMILAGPESVETVE